jgi:hypothetical protein
VASPCDAAGAPAIKVSPSTATLAVDVVQRSLSSVSYENISSCYFGLTTNFRSFLALVRAKIWQVETARREKNPMWTVGGGIIIAVIVLAALPLILWDIVFLIVPISDEPTHHQHPNQANQVTQKAPQLASRVSAISATTNH